jgi:hypothetical protein
MVFDSESNIEEFDETQIEKPIAGSVADSPLKTQES